MKPALKMTRLGPNILTQDLCDAQADRNTELESLNMRRQMLNKQTSSGLFIRCCPAWATGSVVKQATAKYNPLLL
jgi:hypothetical protein